MLTDSFSN